MVDEVLLQAVKGISEVILRPGEMNIDYNDLKTVMLKSGRSLIGMGQAKGPKRHLEAARQALTSPLLENADITGAKGFIVFFSAPDDITMTEQGDVMNIIRQYASNESKVMFGHMYDKNLPEGTFSVTIIATGFAREGAPRLSTVRSSLTGAADAPHETSRHIPLQHISPRPANRTPRSSDAFDSRSDFMLIPAFIRRRREGK